MSEFCCSCDPDGERQGKDIVERVKAELEATDADLLSRIVYSLAHTFNRNSYGYITSIVADQWAAISFKLHRGEEPPYEITVDCDLVEVGLCRGYEIARDYLNGGS